MAEAALSDRVGNSDQTLGEREKYSQTEVLLTLNRPRRRKRQNERRLVDLQESDSKSWTCQVELCLVTGMSAGWFQTPKIPIFE